MNTISGFSLIELMIVVSIISILTVIAVPSYQHYTQRARFTEVIAATEPYKIAVTIALQTGVTASEINLGTNGIPAAPKATKHLASLTVNQGTITATATPLAGNATVILKPDSEGNTWSMSGTCMKNNLCNG